SAFINIHTLDLDETALSASLPYLSSFDPEVFLAVLLMRAPSPELRFDPYGELRPSQVIDAVSPTPGSPGLNRFAVQPSFPRPSYFSFGGLIPVRPSEPVGYAVSALAAFLDSLEAAPRFALNSEGIRRGRVIFENAGCGACH